MSPLPGPDVECLLPARRRRPLLRSDPGVDRRSVAASVVGHGPVVGFAHLEPVRHIPYVTDLDGVEASTFGPVLATATGALRAVVGADLVHAYVFGERVAHFHVNLAPHRDGDALAGGPAMLVPGAPDAPAVDHLAVIAAVRDRLG